VRVFHTNAILAAFSSYMYVVKAAKMTFVQKIGILRHCYDVIVEAFPASTRFKLCFFEKSFGSFFLFPNEVREEEKTP